MTEQHKLATWLKKSPLTPGHYRPTETIRNTRHVGVFSGDTPLVLTGPHDDESSRREAVGLAHSLGFQLIAQEAGVKTPLNVAYIDGGKIAWPDIMGAVVAKEGGEVVDVDGTNGPLVAMVFNEPFGRHVTGVVTSMCVMTDIARILAPDAPDMVTSKSEAKALRTPATQH